MTQAMTETDVDAKQATEGKGASDSLDTLLDEFEQQTKPVEQQTSKIEEVVSWVDEQRQSAIKEKEATDINSAVEAIKSGIGELDFTPTDRMVRGMLQDIASEDTSVAKAFHQRDQNPRAWQEALKRATAAIKEDLSIDPKATSDREAITSAVHSASTKQPAPEEEVNVASMNDREFMEYKTKLMRGG
jgi:hypothetical protein